MNTIISEIKECIEEKLSMGFQKFMIYPYGDIGMKLKNILNNAYGIKESYIFDNYLCKYNKKIKPLETLMNINREGYAIFLATTNKKIFEELKKSLVFLFSNRQIGVLTSMKNGGENK